MQISGGSIGIVLAIPISILVTSVMIKVSGMFHRQKKQKVTGRMEMLITTWIDLLI